MLKISKSEARTRGVLKRTLKKYKQNPTEGRRQAIIQYRIYLKIQELKRTPDLMISFRELQTIMTDIQYSI